MEKHPEYPLYRTQLGLCNKIFNVLGIIYLVTAAVFVISIVPIFFLAMSLRMSFGAFVFCTLFCVAPSIVLGWYAVYRKHQFASILSVFPAVIGVFFLSDAHFIGIIDVMLIAISIVCAVLVTIFGKKYHFLEQQEGFPHFSDLHTEEIKRSEEARKSDPYARNDNYYINENIRGKMDELPDINEKLKVKEDIKNNYMDDI